MICPLCKTNETTDKVVKIQQKIAQGKINLAELSVCDECSDCLVVKAGDSAFVLSLQPTTCNWQEDENGWYETDCDHTFGMITGTPDGNDMTYCPYCGKPIKTIDYMPRVESMCCDCIQPDRHSICGDYSENEGCKHRKEDGSCWK